jgi:hypothetical protein
MAYALAYVYLLGTYDEHGSDGIKATLDRSRLPDILASAKWDGDDLSDEQAELAKLLDRPDAELWRSGGGYAGSTHDLSQGWGGWQLHVVPLE